MRATVPETPQKPFPLSARSHIVSGFGRGSSDLGIPTANVPIETLPKDILDLNTGVYFGFCKIEKTGENVEKKTIKDREIEFSYGSSLSTKELDEVYPYVLSIGWNPFYHNKQKTVEIHIIHEFDSNFYGADIKFNVLGYLRPELDYTTKEALIQDINLDKKLALESLQKDGYQKLKRIGLTTQ